MMTPSQWTAMRDRIVGDLSLIYGITRGDHFCSDNYMQIQNQLFWK